MSRASDQITEYLSVGGLFNPEIMNQTQHEAIRDTLIKARDDIQQLERENAELRVVLDNLCSVADSSMREANRHTAYSWEIEEELRPARSLLRKEAQP